jgi:large subunit ribosomal protein L25
MENRTLKASVRKVKGKGVGALRRSGQLPAVLYGRGTDPIAIELDAKEAARVLDQASGSTLLDLQVDGETHKVLVREVQRHPLRRSMDHVDLLKVALDVAIRTMVPVDLTGEAPAVKLFGGVLVSGVNEIEVEALPEDLPSRITVDLEPLSTMEARITVGDIFAGKGVRILSDSHLVIARVIYQVEEKLEEEVPGLAVAEAEPEIIGRGKKEEEEEEEGEAPKSAPAKAPTKAPSPKGD